MELTTGLSSTINQRNFNEMHYLLKPQNYPLKYVRTDSKD